MATVGICAVATRNSGRFSTYFVSLEAQRNIRRIMPAALVRFEAFLQLSDYEAVEDPDVSEVAAHYQLVRDKKDVVIALVAIHSAVDCLVTNDRDLTESDELRRQVKVLLPAVFLRDYMGWTSDELEAIRHRNWADLA